MKTRIRPEDVEIIEIEITPETLEAASESARRRRDGDGEARVEDLELSRDGETAFFEIKY